MADLTNEEIRKKIEELEKRVKYLEDTRRYPLPPVKDTRIDDWTPKVGGH